MDYLFTSERLGFRNWQKKDHAPFIEMNKDPQVMEFFPTILTDKESVALIERLSKHFDENGYTFFAVERLEDNEFIGFIGVVNMNLKSNIASGPEIGWRLKKSAWGKGYATEGAIRCLQYGFKTLNMQSIYSFTSLINNKSEHVMKKIGMKKIKTFNHPKVSQNHRLEAHCLYLISK